MFLSPVLPYYPEINSPGKRLLQHYMQDVLDRRLSFDIKYRKVYSFTRRGRNYFGIFMHYMGF